MKNLKSFAEWMSLKKDTTSVAELFHVAYLRGGKDRPLTFVFNGGPGAASAFLHLGALGPKRVGFGKKGEILAPPVKLFQNSESWIEFTDLVFVDPMGTGLSHASEKTEKKEDSKGTSKDPVPLSEEKKTDSEKTKQKEDFYQVNRDLDALCEFIERFLNKHHRWQSPVFIAGESYGGFRVGKLARRLQEKTGIALNGCVLISPALEFGSLNYSPQNTLSWVDVFPSYVASAKHHGLCDFTQEQAEAFATSEFAQFLTEFNRTEDSKTRKLLEKTSKMIGLSKELVFQKRGRVEFECYVKELLKDKGRVVGLYDASLSTMDPFPESLTHVGPDCTLQGIDWVFNSAINAHLRENLGVKSERLYNLLNLEAFQAWKVDEKRHAFDTEYGAVQDLRYSLGLNEHTKYFVCHGLFDLITPYMASKRLLNHVFQATPHVEKRFMFKAYKGGHMFYTWEESRKQFQKDARQFYKNAMV
jgi:carboxypeptidase C (cathepsin A)